MEKVRPLCGQPSDRGRLRNRTVLGRCSPLAIVCTTFRASSRELWYSGRRVLTAVNLSPAPAGPHCVTTASTSSSTRLSATSSSARWDRSSLSLRSTRGLQSSYATWTDVEPPSAARPRPPPHGRPVNRETETEG